MFAQLTDWYPVLLSVRVAVIATVVVTCLGLPVSRLLARGEFFGKDVLEAVITLPLVLPPSVVGYGLLILIGKNGLLGKMLAELGVTLIFTWWAAVIASTVVAFPLMYQSAKAAFKSVDINFEKAARTLGASELRIFFTITLPLAWPGILAGLVLTFARALGEFGATLMVAGNIPGQTQTIPLAIYFAVGAGKNEMARTLVAVITVFSFIVIYWVNRWAKKHQN
ncbi:molybdate ABC transporter permease subunit [Pelotomaculum terephthalicicum JT]|uniref:molybdate ABC transporter permease subunit n=1 Tax=Pelotomaculum TaxID=191373 RepID=UPI0009D2F7A4|nr:MULTISPECIES: molybdate ABC transporter permease subunit [Pelotomaculum]MCG9966601.1 molybdate ABC transporter permease subunit [Pelotomaculum terephthalicicum JT]OPX89702.1 MAG: Molybdenum transport system permease protein ModB [Pelotomaculum sp. PtaB.Bin117]OPY63541.1 MAG: Molybdenum transport system permease protein ModB [Pelotomaculum sp. PtaU1.Bin065]